MERCRLIVLLLFMLATLFSCEGYDASGEEQLAEATKRAMAEGCRTPETTDADIEAFLKEDSNMSYQAKCVGACILQKFEFITADGKFNIEGAKHLYQVIETDKEILALRFEVMEHCQSVEADDVCEFSYALGICIDEKGEELGVGDW